METKGKGFGAIRGYAGGGLIAGLKGMLGMKTETVTEKFARQDAEFRAKHPQPAAPASAPAKAPAQGNTAIGDYAGMTALQKREKAAGLKAGGMVKKKCVDGGQIEGPGGPTDDLVPIMASNGEFMIKAKSAKILGPELLEALNDVGGKEEPKKGDKMKVGGMIRKMAVGGDVEEAPTSGFSDQAKANGRAMLDSYVPIPMPEIQMKAGGMVRKPVLHMAQAGSVSQALEDQYGIKADQGYLQSVGDKLKSGIKAVSSAGNFGSPEQTSAAPGPYSDPSRKLDIAPTSPTVATSPGMPTMDNGYRGKSYSDPRDPSSNAAALNDPASNASILAQNPAGAVRKVGNSYSGANVSGNVGFVGADGNPISGRPGGGYLAGGAPAPVIQSLANPDGSQWSAGDNAIMAANIRDGIDKYRGTSRDARNDPMNQPMTKAKRSALVQMAQVNSQDKRYADQNAIAQGQLGVSQEQLGLNRDKQATDTGMEKIRQQLWAAYTNGTPEQKAQAAEQLQMLNGKNAQQEKFTVVPEYDGNGTRIGTTVLNSKGEQVNTNGQSKAAVPDAATARTQALAALKANPANKDEINKRLAAAGYPPI